MNTEELKRLAESATPGPWNDYAGVLRKIGEQSQIATIYRSYNSRYIAAANPTAILELIQQRDELLVALKRIKANLMHQRLRGQSAGLLHAAIQAEGDAEEIIAKMEG